MTVSKARILGRLYFFLVTFIIFIPVSYGLTCIHVFDQVAETYITYDSDGDAVKNYKLETVSEEEWEMLREEYNTLIDIVGVTTLVTSGYYGASFGEDVIIKNQPRSHTWDDRSRKMFVYSLLIGSTIWHPIFIVGMYGFNAVIMPHILYGAFVNVMISYAGAGNIAVHFGEGIIHRLLTLHI